MLASGVAHVSARRRRRRHHPQRKDHPPKRMHHPPKRLHPLRNQCLPGDLSWSVLRSSQVQETRMVYDIFWWTFCEVHVKLCEAQSCARFCQNLILSHWRWKTRSFLACVDGIWVLLVNLGTKHPPTPLALCCYILTVHSFFLSTLSTLNVDEFSLSIRSSLLLNDMWCSIWFSWS